MTTFWAKILLITLKRQDFVQNFLLINSSKYELDPDPESEQKLFQSRDRNRKKKFRLLRTDFRTPIFFFGDHAQNQYADDTDSDTPIRVNPYPNSMINDPKHIRQNRETIFYHSIMLKMQRIEGIEVGNRGEVAQK
jgi:hypothetical protein